MRRKLPFQDLVHPQFYLDCAAWIVVGLQMMHQDFVLTLNDKIPQRFVFSKEIVLSEEIAVDDRRAAVNSSTILGMLWLSCPGSKPYL